nr:ribonuclease H-like domain, reverse transcriptase, RNA-dependent DNA polymerase [Tanacetum cinerariifolium]
MAVKSAFLYETIEEEVYVCQPLGFEDLDYPDKVYKVVKALYGLLQAPRAWYETLANYLLENGFQRGKIDQTLFINRKKLMKDKFQMSSMGELRFFLDLQVKQKKDGIFISQDKYVAKILRKFGKLNAIQRYTLLDCIFLGFRLTMQVVISGMESLKWMLRVTNILSAGYLTTPQMVLNSPCLTHIKKNWLVQIKLSL